MRVCACASVCACERELACCMQSLNVAVFGLFKPILQYAFCLFSFYGTMIGNTENYIRSYMCSIVGPSVLNIRYRLFVVTRYQELSEMSSISASDVIAAICDMASFNLDQTFGTAPVQ